MTEKLTVHQPETKKEQERRVIEMERARLERLTESPSPAEALGNLALTYFVGGALTQGAVLPRTEVIAMEGVVVATDYADRQAVANSPLIC